MTKYFLDAIPQSVINEVINDYNSRGSYETASMNKAAPGKSLHLVLPYCLSKVGKDLEYKSGNFYKHSIPYLPHTDYRVDQGNEVNIVIPLQYTGEQASLIVFDQSWDNDSVTWCLDGEVIDFAVNTGVKGRPYDYDAVDNLTFKPINLDFYNKYLSHHRRECFLGLSGTAFKFQPTTMIIFDNRLIHCTSKFKGEKLGLSLRFVAK